MLKIIIIGSFFFQNIPAVDQKIFILDSHEVPLCYTQYADTLGCFKTSIIGDSARLKGGINIYMEYSKDDIYCYTRKHINYNALTDTVRIKENTLKKELVSLDICFVVPRNYSPLKYSWVILRPFMLFKPTRDYIDSSAYNFKDENLTPEGAEIYNSGEGMFLKKRIWVSKGRYRIIGNYCINTYAPKLEKKMGVCFRVKSYRLNYGLIKKTYREDIFIDLEISKNSRLYAYVLSRRKLKRAQDEWLERNSLK